MIKVFLDIEHDQVNDDSPAGGSASASASKGNVSPISFYAQVKFRDDGVQRDDVIEIPAALAELHNVKSP